MDNRPWRVRVILTHAESAREDLWAGVVIGVVFAVAGVGALTAAAESSVFLLFGLLYLALSLTKVVRDGRLLLRSRTPRE